DRSACEGPLAIERFVERHAEAELVAKRVGWLTAELLGRHVGGGPDQAARGRQVAGHARGRVRERRPSFRLSRQPSQSKISHTDASVATEQGIAWLEIPMRDPGGVRRRETASRFDEASYGFAPGPRFPAQPILQRLAFDQ